MGASEQIFQFLERRRIFDFFLQRVVHTNSVVQAYFSCRAGRFYLINEVPA